MNQFRMHLKELIKTNRNDKMVNQDLGPSKSKPRNK